jgi:DNA (cytosine-5)-methyltransferase 1
VKYIDVCSGISAPTMAWKPLGWDAACFAEIEAAPRSVLAHHYPGTPLRGDFTEIKGTEYGPVDLLVGGTPCQSFSVAGLRGGLADDRGNLALEYLRLADRARPRWLVWENVPGVLSSNGGRDFGAILGGMGELGYGFAYAVLDAQFFGVPQRRRRVFVVGYLGDWRRAAAVLFERHSLSGHPAPRREAGERVARPIAAGSRHSSGYRNDADTADNLITPPVTCAPYGDNASREGLLVAFDRQSNCEYGDGEIASTIHARDFKSATDLICDTLTSNGDAHSGYRDAAGLVPVAIQERAASENVDAGPQGKGWQEDCAYTLEARNKVQAVAFDTYNQDTDSVAQSLRDGHGAGTPTAFNGSAVRRLTPRECERLQGFPDDFTLVPHRNKPMADGPRYKMLGNSMAVPVLRWIGERIQMVDALASLEAAA